MSANAEACPACGEPTKKKKSVGKGSLWASYILSVVMPVIGWVMAIYLLFKGRVGHALSVGTTGVFFAFVWLAAFSSQPSFSWECVATGVSSLQCEIKNNGATEGTVSFDVIAFCGDNKHKGTINSGKVGPGSVVQRVVTLDPRIGVFDDCAGIEYHNEEVR